MWFFIKPQRFQSYQSLTALKIWEKPLVYNFYSYPQTTILVWVTYFDAFTIWGTSIRKLSKVADGIWTVVESLMTWIFFGSRKLGLRSKHEALSLNPKQVNKIALAFTTVQQLERGRHFCVSEGSSTFGEWNSGMAPATLFFDGLRWDWSKDIAYNA